MDFVDSFTVPVNILTDDDGKMFVGEVQSNRGPIQGRASRNIHIATALALIAMGQHMVEIETEETQKNEEGGN